MKDALRLLKVYISDEIGSRVLFNTILLISEAKSENEEMREQAFCWQLECPNFISSGGSSEFKTFHS